MTQKTFLWYWSGGREVGSWNVVLCSEQHFSRHETELASAGYVSKRSSIKPEGAPVNEEFERLGL